MGEDQDRFSRAPADGRRNSGFGFKEVRDAGSEKTDVSIVVPLFNEEDNVGLLCSAIDEALAGWEVSYEVILVDDGSRDRTFERAAEAIRYKSNFFLLKMRRNHGQTTAMAAGIDFARGNVIVTMDGDLQNDPRDIPIIYGKLREGYDIVVGWREKRQDKLMSRRVPSIAANWLIARLTRTHVHDNGCTLKCFKSTLIKNIPLYSELHRFIPALASVFGARLAEIKVNHHPRLYGKSKYTLSRVHKVIVDLLSVSLIIRAARWPMVWAFGFAVGPLVLSGVLAAVALWGGWIGGTVVVPTALSLLALNVGGFMLSLGLIAELIFRFAALTPAKFPRFTMQRYERNN